MLAKRGDPYAGTDLANAGRIGAALWLAGAVFTAIVLPLAPPTAAVGDAGWAIAIAIVVLAVAAGLRLRSGGATVNVDELLLNSYASVAALAVLAWLSGGIDSPYTHLMLLAAVFTSAVHPPRRVVPFLLGLVVLALLPLVHDKASDEDALSLVTEVLIWLVLCAGVIALMEVVRAQRLGLRREGEQARRQARIDPLTGLLNRRAFDETLARWIDRARITGEPLSVLVGDLDDFKAINDRFGHLEGDRLLVAVATSLQDALRGADVGYRWGGDEFALILPGASAEAASHVADRIRSAVATSRTPDGRPVGLATGVAQFDRNRPGGAEALLAAADAALIRAKRSGPLEVPGTPG